MPKVSILLPTYNRGEFFKKALKSVLMQSFSDFEIIVTDNSSNHEAEIIVNEFQDSRIRYFRNKENIGAVNNHNKALRLAEGQYIYLFSDDDVMVSDNILDKVTILDEQPAVGLVYSNVSLINEDDVISDKLHWTNLNEEWLVVKSSPYMSKEVAHRLLYYGTLFVCMPTVMLRRSVLVDNNIEFNNQLRYMIDWDLFLKMSLFCDFYYIDNKYVLYRFHNSNETFKLNRGNYYLELLMSKLSLDALYKELDWLYPESRFVDVCKSTAKQIKWWGGGIHSPNLKRIRALASIIKRITR